MKKNYFLLTAVLISTVALAQNNKLLELEEIPIKPTVQQNSPKKVKVRQQKAIGDTLYYEDFAGGMPAGWTTQNNTGNTNDWIWSNTAPGGQYSNAVSSNFATTSSNGFLSMPSGFYNTPTPPGGFVTMDASVTSPAITILPSPTVYLSWQQSQRYCCSATHDSLLVRVSADGVHWTTYNAAFGRSANTAVIETTCLNVSAALANSTTAYIQFYKQASHYYWMVDDLTLLSVDNVLEISNEQYKFNYFHTYNPSYTIMPLILLDPVEFSATVSNLGGVAQPNTRLRLEIYQDSTIVGTTGVGLVFADSTPTVMNPLATRAAETLQPSTYNPAHLGKFRATLRAKSDSINQLPFSSVDEYAFELGHSLMARDRGVASFNGDAGPSNYAGGGNNGDRWAVLYTVGSYASQIVMDAVKLFVANNSNNIGVSIKPQVWDLCGLSSAGSVSSAFGATPIATSPFTHTISPNELGTWVTLPIFPPLLLTDSCQYGIGWEQVGGGGSGLEFTVGRDRTMEPFAEPVTNFVYISTTGSWGWISQVAAVRATIRHGSISIGENTSNSEFKIAPNPSDGLFTLNIMTDRIDGYNLNIINIVGETVFTKQIEGELTKTVEMNLKHLKAGIYFIALENDSERVVQKLLIE